MYRRHRGRAFVFRPSECRGQQRRPRGRGSDHPCCRGGHGIWVAGAHRMASNMRTVVDQGQAHDRQSPDCHDGNDASISFPVPPGFIARNSVETKTLGACNAREAVDDFGSGGPRRKARGTRQQHTRQACPPSCQCPRRRRETLAERGVEELPFAGWMAEEGRCRGSLPAWHLRGHGVVRSGSVGIIYRPGQWIKGWAFNLLFCGEMFPRTGPVR